MKREQRGLPPKKFRNFVSETVKEIKAENGLQDYDISFQHSPKTKKVGDDQQVVAEININPKYLEASLCTYPPLLDSYKDKDLNRVRQVLCHELAHIRTDGLKRMATERFVTEGEFSLEWEKLTEIIGRLMFDYIYYKKYHKRLSNGKRQTKKPRQPLRKRIRRARGSLHKVSQ